MRYWSQTAIPEGQSRQPRLDIKIKLTSLAGNDGLDGGDGGILRELDNVVAGAVDEDLHLLYGKVWVRVLC